MCPPLQNPTVLPTNIHHSFLSSNVRLLRFDRCDKNLESFARGIMRMLRHRLCASLHPWLDCSVSWVRVIVTIYYTNPIWWPSMAGIRPVRCWPASQRRHSYVKQHVIATDSQTCLYYTKDHTGLHHSHNSVRMFVIHRLNSMNKINIGVA